MPIPFKIAKCVVCEQHNKKLISKKCFESPNFCYQKAQKEKYLKKQKPQVKKPIKKVSDRRIKRLSEYRKVRDIFLKENNICQFPNCKSKNVELHHSAGRVGNLLVDKKHFKALCREHHNWIELHPIKAKELKLSVNRL